MSKSENVRKLEKAISEWLILKEVVDFRWITEEECSVDDNFETCLIIDGDAHLYLWELYGMEEMDQISQNYGYSVEPQNYIDIGFYSIAEWQAIPLINSGDQK